MALAMFYIMKSEGIAKSLFSSNLYELFFKSQEGQFNLEITHGFIE